MKVEQGVRVVAESEVAVIADPTEQTACWEWPIGVVGQGVMLEVVFDLLPVGEKAARQDFQGASSQERNGSGAGFGTVQP